MAQNKGMGWRIPPGPVTGTGDTRQGQSRSSQWRPPERILMSWVQPPLDSTEQQQNSIARMFVAFAAPASRWRRGGADPSAGWVFRVFRQRGGDVAGRALGLAAWPKSKKRLAQIKEASGTNRSPPPVRAASDMGPGTKQQGAKDVQERRSAEATMSPVLLLGVRLWILILVCYLDDVVKSSSMNGDTVISTLKPSSLKEGLQERELVNNLVTITSGHSGKIKNIHSLV
mmetsp:Transcript_89932/g.240295  ORF Transcript_89932/g.240295 Transcript_89932/m.240295 type:complete len:229 (-) Transcript_89932:219-905(-)